MKWHNSTFNANPGSQVHLSLEDEEYISLDITHYTSKGESGDYYTITIFANNAFINIRLSPRIYYDIMEQMQYNNCWNIDAGNRDCSKHPKLEEVRVD